jgi:hypothetical protein
MPAIPRYCITRRHIDRVPALPTDAPVSDREILPHDAGRVEMRQALGLRRVSPRNHNRFHGSENCVGCEGSDTEDYVAEEFAGAVLVCV